MRLTFILLFTLLVPAIYAQAPQGFTFQAVLRDAQGQLVSDSTVNLRISILENAVNGAPVYIETHDVQTNANGLATLEVGSGLVQFGDFAMIDWGIASFFIRTEVDFILNGNYSLSSASQLLSVPYALHARTAADDNDRSPTNELQVISKSGNSISLSNGGGVVTDDVDDADADSTNEIQVLSISNDTIFLTNGGFVVLPQGFDGQYSSLIGAPTNVSSFTNDAGYITTEVDGSITNELQALSISNDTVFLTNGGFVVLPAGFDGQYSSLTGAPTNVSAFTNDAGYLTSEVDGSVTNELQALSISNDTIFLSNGGFVVLPVGFSGDFNSLTNVPVHLDTDSTDDFNGQYSSLTGAPTNVSAFTNDAGYVTSEVDGDTTNELQTITLSNDQLNLTDGGSVDLSSYSDSASISQLNSKLSADSAALAASISSNTSSISSNSSNISTNSVNIAALNTELDADSLVLAAAINQNANAINTHVQNDADTSITNELQFLTLSNDTLSIASSGANEVDLAPYLDNTDTQQLSLSADTLMLTNGGFVVLPEEIDGDTTNEVQNLQQVLSEGNNAGADSILNLGGVSIGTNALDTTSVVDIQSTSKGVLMPRMTQAQRELISNPADGLMVYQTDENYGFYFFMSGEWYILQKASSFSSIETTNTLIYTTNGF